jgi:hypothetical protein
MSLTVGGKKKTKFRMLAGMPDTHSMAGMPKKGSPGTMEHGLTDYDYMPTIPGKRYGYKTLKGMPNTRQLNGGWGADHPGNIENQNRTKSLLQKKRDSCIQDPQEKRNQGKMKMDETDNVPGFLKDKLSRNGSLSTAPTGLCLEGEEDGAIPPDGTFYGIKDGKRGWYPVGGVQSDKDAQKISKGATVVREVVDDVEWNAETHQLVMIKRKMVVVADAEVDSQPPVKSVIFTATPLQEELS